MPVMSARFVMKSEPFVNGSGRHRPSPGYDTLTGGAPHGMVAEVEHVHARLEEAVDGVAGRADDRLVLVEGGVEDDGHARQLSEVGDEPVVALVHAARDG